MVKIVELDSFCNESAEVYVHPNKAAALDWVKKNLPNGSNDGCSLLVFYKNEYENIRALPPLNKSAEINEKLRIIGANNEMEETFLQKFGDVFHPYGYKVPRLAQLKEDEIIPGAPYGILIVYEKREKKVGEFFYNIISELKAELVDKVKLSKINSPNLQIDIRKLMEEASLLAIQRHDGKNIESDLLSGRVYYIYKDKVIRYTFKRDTANKAEQAFLLAEKKDEKAFLALEEKNRNEARRLAKPVEVYTEKTENHHHWSAFKGYWKVFMLGLMTETVLLVPLIPILIALHFFPASLPLILAAVVVAVLGVAITAWTMQKGFKQVAEENKTTIDYGKTTFREHSVSVFQALQGDIKHFFQVRLLSSSKIQKSESLQPIVESSFTVGVNDSSLTQPIFVPVISQGTTPSPTKDSAARVEQSSSPSRWFNWCAFSCPSVNAKQKVDAVGTNANMLDSPKHITPGIKV
jgi:hypothetical protein